MSDPIPRKRSWIIGIILSEIHDAHAVSSPPMKPYVGRREKHEAAPLGRSSVSDLILRRMFRAIHHQDLDGHFAGFELQAELLG